MFDDKATVIEIAIDLARLIAFFHHLQFLLQARNLPPRRSRQALKLARIMGREVAPALSIVTVEPILSDKSAQPVERPARRANQRHGVSRAVASRQYGVTRFDLAADLTAVASTATPTRICCVDNEG